MEISKLTPLLKNKIEFNVTETLQLLSFNKPIFWSWGVSSMTNIANKGLLLNVSGNHHKGLVLVTLDGNDTYTVYILSMRKTVLNTFENVYFDQLVEIIDNRIEKIKDYVY